MNQGIRIVPLARCGNLANAKFAPETEWILIGRDRGWTLNSGGRPASAISREARLVFPSAETLVGRRHLILKKEPNGNWSARPQADGKGAIYHTSVDGIPADGPKFLSSGSIIRLGKTNGPAIRIEIPKPRGSSLLSGLQTAVQDPVPTWRNAVRTLTQHMAMAFAVLLLLLGGGTYWFWERFVHLELRVTDQGDRLEALETSFEREVAEAEKRALNQRPAGFSPEAIENLRTAAHLIIARKGERAVPLATAWPIATGNRVVTNAHVVAQLAKLPPSYEVQVCRHGNPGDCVAVTDRISTHPAYAVFQKYKSDSNLGSEDLIGNFKPAEPPGGYDIAVLGLEPGANLGPVLELAGPQDYLELGPGTPIAFAGYLLRGVDGIVSRVHFGTVSALTDFLMTDPADGNPARTYLVHNTIPVTGGASGGPVINSAGKVVAILSSGTVVDIPASGEPGTQPVSAPSAALVNYAQRIDILDQMLSAHPFNMDEERQYWDRQITQFLSYRDYLVRTFLESPTPYDRRSMSPWQHLTRDIKERYDATEARFPVEKGKRYAVLAYAGSRAEISLDIKVGGKELKPDPGRSSRETFLAREDGEATVTIRSSASEPSAFELLIYRSD